MNILDESVVWEWCRDHRVALSGDEPGSGEVIRLAQYSDAPHRARVRYANGRRSGRESAIALAAVQALGAWDECLVWITQWGVWPSGEDWPRFYAWRGGHGERRSLDVAPGHLFQAPEHAELEALLTQILEYAWDAALLPARAGEIPDRRIVVSHDEWIEVQSQELVDVSLAETTGT